MNLHEIIAEIEKLPESDFFILSEYVYKREQRGYLNRLADLKEGRIAGLSHKDVFEQVRKKFS